MYMKTMSKAKSFCIGACLIALIVYGIHYETHRQEALQRIEKEYHRHMAELYERRVLFRFRMHLSSYISKLIGIESAVCPQPPHHAVNIMILDGFCYDLYELHTLTSNFFQLSNVIDAVVNQILETTKHHDDRETFPWVRLSKALLSTSMPRTHNNRCSQETIDAIRDVCSSLLSSI